jgi:pyruvate-formate lyase
MKRTITSAVREIDLWILEGSLENAIMHIRNCFKEAVNKGYSNCRIKIQDSGEYESYSEILQIVGDRLETDQEYEKRIKYEEKIKLFQEKRDNETKERELKLLAKLKKKYEKIIP